jgi:hypothetical protein
MTEAQYRQFFTEAKATEPTVSFTEFERLFDQIVTAPDIDLALDYCKTPEAFARYMTKQRPAGHYLFPTLPQEMTDSKGNTYFVRNGTAYAAR